jgi:hypothetical protein
VSVGLGIWLGRTYKALLGAEWKIAEWRGKAVTAEVLRSRDAYGKAVDDEAKRPREYPE